jgi:hypothetical protein
MTRKIMELAREAGLPTAWISETGVLTWTDLEAFATLVREDALAEPGQERNFCPRCGKRTQDIHTCTPPQEST